MKSSLPTLRPADVSIKVIAPPAPKAPKPTMTAAPPSVMPATVMPSKPTTPPAPPEPNAFQKSLEIWRERLLPHRTLLKAGALAMAALGVASLASANFFGQGTPPPVTAIMEDISRSVPPLMFKANQQNTAEAVAHLPASTMLHVGTFTGRFLWLKPEGVRLTDKNAAMALVRVPVTDMQDRGSDITGAMLEAAKQMGKPGVIFILSDMEEDVAQPKTALTPVEASFLKGQRILFIGGKEKRPHAADLAIGAGAQVTVLPGTPSASTVQAALLQIPTWAPFAWNGGILLTALVLLLGGAYAVASLPDKNAIIDNSSVEKKGDVSSDEKITDVLLVDEKNVDKNTADLIAPVLLPESRLAPKPMFVTVSLGEDVKLLQVERGGMIEIFSKAGSEERGIPQFFVRLRVVEKDKAQVASVRPDGAVVSLRDRHTPNEIVDMQRNSIYLVSANCEFYIGSGRNKIAVAILPDSSADTRTRSYNNGQTADLVKAGVGSATFEL